MINFCDNDYKSTKKIKLGKDTLNADFAQFAGFIYSNYKTKLLNILFEKLKNSNRYRLSLIVEYSTELINFYRKDYYALSSRIEKTIIAEFRKQMIDQKLEHKYPVDDFFVYVTAFERVAKDEVTSKIKLKEYKKLINNSEIWEIQNWFSSVVIFLFTDKQVKKYKNSDAKKVWEEEYLKMLQPHDTFGYFPSEKFEIHLDSKENFDKNYQSNWYYYYK